ncbi:MAG: hypothetical protein AAF591_16915 [Verrucomicrobiota bacterium]
MYVPEIRSQLRVGLNAGGGVGPSGGVTGRPSWRVGTGRALGIERFAEEYLPEGAAPEAG